MRAVSTAVAAKSAEATRRPQSEPAQESAGPAEASAPGPATDSGAGMPIFLSRASPAPPPLIVGPPGDEYEQEAERIAERITTSAAAGAPPGGEKGDPPVRRFSGAGGTSRGSDRVPEPAARAIAAPGAGSPLSPATRQVLEPRLGAPLGHVRVHDDAAARDAARVLGARAFTHGPHVWLGPGESQQDLRLIAHEAVHVLQQREGGSTVQRQPGGAPTIPSPAPAPGVFPPQGPPPPLPGFPGPPPPAPAPAAGPGVPSPPPVPAEPSGTTEIVVPPQQLMEADEKTLKLFDLPIVNKRLWETVVKLPPPLFAATVGVTARVGLKAELFLRYGPITLRDIRLSYDTAASRYSGTAQLYLPVAAGPRATLSGSLIGSAEWLGLVEMLSFEGGLRAIGQAPLIVALAPSVAVLYDRGTFTLNARPQLEAGVALIFDLEAFVKASVLGDEVWKKKWNLYHWQWGRAVRMGASLSLDYINGDLQPVRVEPFAERFSIDELLEGMRAPAEDGSITIIPPGRRPLDERLQELIGTGGTDPQVILTALAEATPQEKAALLADEAVLGAVRGALGPSNAAIARRILNNQPSETVPSLDEGTVFLAARHIRIARHQDALHVVVSRLQATGVIDGSLASFSYGRETGSGEGLTTTRYDRDPATGIRTPRRPSRVEIYDPAFVNVPWLVSTVMHEYVHVLQAQRDLTPAEWADPDEEARSEVEAYLWEVEHAHGTGVIVSGAQMEEIGRRLTRHFLRMSAPARAPYQARYDAAMVRVREAASGVVPVNVTFSVADARRAVQESSARIAELVRLRPDPGGRPPTPAERREQERIDREIATIQRERAEMLVEVVLAENPNVQIVDRARGIYRVPVTDGRGQVQWIFGSISVVWHLHRVSPSVFDIGARIRSQPASADLPPGTTVSPRMLVGGSGIQSTVQPYPGDIDFGEEFDVLAPDAASAGAAMAEVVAEFVARGAAQPDFEFVSMNVRRSSWSAEAILDPTRRAELANQMADLEGGKVNTFWRALLPDGRFIEITKVLGINAISSTTGDRLFATTWMGAEYQEAYLDQPHEIEPVALGEYAALMRSLAIREADKGHYLKAAKRAFNYFRAIGNMEAMDAVAPVFATTEARLNQQVAVLETIQSTLLPAGVATRILTADRARALLNEAADMIEVELPTVPGGGAPVADELRDIARGIRETTTPPVGMVEQDGVLADRLNDVLELKIKPAIDGSLAGRVSQIIDRYVR